MDEGLVIVAPVTAAGTQATIPVGCGYCGFAANATAAGVLEVRDGSATGPLLDAMVFTAAGGQQSYYGPAPLWCNGRPWVVQVSGALPALTLRYR